MSIFKYFFNLLGGARYDCDSCPCLNIDQEDPCDCNLGYTVQSERIDGNWYHVSSDCELLEIRTLGKKIVPTLFKT